MASRFVIPITSGLPDKMSGYWFWRLFRYFMKICRLNFFSFTTFFFGETFYLVKIHLANFVWHFYIFSRFSVTDINLNTTYSIFYGDWYYYRALPNEKKKKRNADRVLIADYGNLRIQMAQKQAGSYEWNVLATIPGE